jgi:hypothetical protein
MRYNARRYASVICSRRNVEEGDRPMTVLQQKASHPALTMDPKLHLRCPQCEKVLSTVDETPGVQVAWKCIGGHTGTMPAGT